MSEKSKQTAHEIRKESADLQNAIQTVLEMEQSFKLYSYRIINTDDFKNGLNAIFDRYLDVGQKIQSEYDKAEQSQKATA